MVVFMRLVGSGERVTNEDAHVTKRGFRHAGGLAEIAVAQLTE
jgi:hypothetical protein